MRYFSSVFLERLIISDGSDAPGVEWRFADTPGSIRKWTFLPRTDATRELFPYAAIACCGGRHIEALRRQIAVKFKLGEAILEYVQVRHAPQERGGNRPVRRGGGWIVTPHAIHPLRKTQARHLDAALPFSGPMVRQGNKGWLLIGYGRDVRSHEGTDCFEFGDLHHRLKRCAALFEPEARLTDAVAFLQRLHYKGVIYGRYRSKQFLLRLNRELGELLSAPSEAWKNQRHDFKPDWNSMAKWQKTLAIIVLDIARHVFDASAELDDPFEQSGVALFDGLPQGITAKRFMPFLVLLDRLFPNLQFILSLTKDQSAQAPKELRAKALAVPASVPKPTSSAPKRLQKGTALLIDVDGELPNLALMKLSRFLKNQGQRVALTRRGAGAANPSRVLASCVFSCPGSEAHVARLRQLYGGDLELGGSGVDVRKRLPAEVEALDPDYSIYPELGDRAMGFLTRGCSRHCSFCIVPVKEGKSRLVASLDGLLQGRKKLILLDDNLLGYSSAAELLEEMVRRDIQVNFNQTLDLGLMTPEIAALLRRIRPANVKFTRRVLHFSLNDNRRLDLYRRHYMRLQTDSRDNVQFICMYGYNTTLAEDVERFQFLRTLPGAYVFVQRYRPVLGGPEPDLSRFFDDRSDERIDALLRVNYQQNMKSMEVYYRWLCELYARQCGRIHRPLVDTLYRYNNRHRMGVFLAKLETICRSRQAAEAA